MFFLLNEIHAYFCMYFSVTSQKMMVKIDKNAYLSLFSVLSIKMPLRQKNDLNKKNECE